MSLPRLTRAEAEALAREHVNSAPCPSCKPFTSPGWEAFPTTVDESLLRPVGALWLPGDDEPTLEEAPRPVGVDSWSPLAPISFAHHPCNRCEVWACVRCGLPFLRYTEYGGYYVQPRIRQLQAGRMVPGSSG
ncbi:hypothetical protein [Ramlibacter albus]|uniref:Uncharacterized protein n=1 Tax=Ramlibacter albus TaxID=2079448 RepID=A0A923MAE3_9BURK|nr:hypothetical protein [Ramlibacter albus]MBC5765718.1 hypothetical protein [Ramlibacter albus]